MSPLLLAWHCLTLSLVAFGAATSVVPELHRILVDNLQVMSADTFAGLFALSQAAPGTNAMFVAVLGLEAAGLAGAFSATVAFFTPTAMIAVSIERFGRRFRDDRWYVSLRRAVAPITVGLLFATGYLLGKNTLTPGGLLLALGAAGILTFTKLTPLWLTALGALLGAFGLV